MATPAPSNGGDPDHRSSSRRLDPDALKRLARIAAAEPTAWDPEDLGAVWRHQLAAPLAVELASSDPVVGLRAAQLCERHVPPAVRSFADLLFHPAPSLELLRLVTVFTNKHLSDPEPSLPRDVAVGLHNVALLAIRLSEGGSRSPDRSQAVSVAELRRRAEWLARQPWLDAQGQRLVGWAIETLPNSDSTAGDLT